MSLTHARVGRAVAGRRQVERHRAPRSLRHPWTRAGLSGLVLTMLPFTWVLELDGCTDSVRRSATGIDLLSELDLVPPDLALALVLSVVALLTPRAAAFAGGARNRVWVHALGLLATSVIAGRGILLVIGSTEVRTIQAAGLVVVSALVTALLDAIVRVGFGAMEKMDHDRHVRARGG